MFKSTRTTRPWAFAATSVLALSMIGATGANADPGSEYGNIDADATGSITIHKHEYQGPGSNIVGAPNEATSLPNPLAGAEFSVTKIESIGSVAIDLDTQSGWDAITGVTANADCSVTGATTGTPTHTALTQANGETVAANLQVGAYLVCETITPEGVRQKASPFIVTVPYPHHTGDPAQNSDSAKWVYDVHVYPKNSKGGIVKDIAEQQDYALGSIVNFPVTADVRTIDAAEHFTYFAVLDNFDPRFTPTAHPVASVKVPGATVDPALYTVAVKGQKVYVVFSNAGLNWLTANAQGQQVEVVFSAEVTGVGDGFIKNIASLYTDTSKVQPTPGDPTDPTNPGPDPENPVVPGDPSDPTDPNYPVDPDDPLVPDNSNEVETVWGNVLIMKADDEDSTVGLQGAKFAVYESTAPYAATCSASTKGDAVKVTGSKENLVVTSDQSGLVTIPGLFVRDSKEGAGSAHRCYILEEIEAPAGYAIPQESDLALTITPGANDLTTDPILNTKRRLGFLPSTGAAGQVLLTLAGAAGVLCAAGLVMVRRRKLAANA